MPDSLLPPRFLFRFSALCRQRTPIWSAEGAELDERYRLPDFGQLDGVAPLGDVRMAWSEEGLALAVEVRGKRQPPWCRESRPDDSDGVRVWIDTRDTHNIHRASRFCHQFIFMPGGTGRGLDEPVAEQLLINRATLPVMCSAPTFRKTAPKEPMKDPNRTNTMELRGVAFGFMTRLLFQTEDGNAADDERNANAPEEVHMFPQHKQRKNDYPYVRQSDDGK